MEDDDVDQVALNPSLVLKLLQHAAEEREDERLKMSNGAVQTTAELLRCFILSARSKAEAEASAEGDDAIRPDHIEAILAELLVDF